MRAEIPLAVLLFLTPASLCGPSASTTSPRLTLTWSDEFSSADGFAPDPTKWNYDVGGDGWGNKELESYTSRLRNVQIQNGNLVIIARQEDFTGADGMTRNYTSARLKTQNLFAQAYGRFEARIKIPQGQGIWPAFWALGNDIGQNGWPQSGEIDIMENIGREPGINHASLHGPSGVAATSDLTGTFVLSSGQKLADDFHVYAIEWDYATFTRAQWPAGGQWVFDHPFFIILNVAVGGGWPGAPDATTQFPQQMLVDYVRVYSKR
jgi:beta-glucanase (GH16 family)